MFICLGYWCNAQSSCNISVNAGPDIFICENETGSLNGMVSGNYDEYEWVPPTGLGDPFDLNTSVSVTGRTTYKLVARGTGNNLIINGGLESGSIAPAVSGFNYVTIPNFPLAGGGSYTIGTAVSFGSIWGCAPNSGTYAMGYNGTGAAGVDLWCQTVSVLPNTDYKLEAWLMSVVIPFFSTNPSISIRVNGSTVASATGSPTLNCSWSNATGTWNSGGSTTATVCIVNNNGGTNYGGLDDISMIECCVVEDEVVVDVETVDAVINQAGPITCDNPTLILDASGSSSGPGYRYEWSTPNGRIISGGNTLNPVIGEPGTYTLKVISPNDCEKEVTIEIEGNNKPPELQTRDGILTCKNSPILVVVSSSNGDVTYEWRGPNGFFSFNQSFNTDIPGTYYVKVEDDFKCFSIDSVIILDQRSFPNIDILGDTITCGKDSVTLGSQSDSWNLVYEWVGPNGSTSQDSTFFTSDSGTYILTVTDSNDCVSMDTFMVLKNDLAFNAFAIPDTITCANPIATLIGYSDSSNVTFSWQGPNGFMEDGDRIQVSDSGTYILTVTYDSLCSTMDTIFVPKADDVPDLSLVGDTITCLNDSALLVGASSTVGSTLSWSGPNNFSSKTGTITVGDTGVYTLLITGPNGCVAEKNFTVISDTQARDVSISSDTLTCDIDSIVLFSSGLMSMDMTSWQGPAGFSSDTPNPKIGQPGLYVLTTTAPNGCTSLDSVIVAQNRKAPIIFSTMDTIDCNQTTIDLTVSNSLIKSWNWNGPMGFMEDSSTIEITLPGLYNLTVVGYNGCDTTITFDIQADTTKPSFSLAADTIDCQNSEVMISVQTSDNGQYIWSGPNGYSSSDQMPAVRDSGWYILELVNENGCSKVDSIFVAQKEALPDISALGDTLDCNKSSTTLVGSSQTPNVILEWTDPFGQTTNGTDLFVQSGGIYTFKVRTAAGCESSLDVTVAMDTLSPNILSLSTDGLKCDSTSTRLNSEVDSLVTIYEWLGPGGFISGDPNPRVSEVGWYYLTVKGDNGCSSLDSIFLVAQDTRPDIMIQADTFTCLRDTIKVTGLSNSPGVTYSWTGPMGFSSNDSSFTTSLIGQYILTVRDINDCSTVDTIDVQENYATATSNLMADSLRCRNSMAQVSATTKPSNALLTWTGPSGFTSTEFLFTTSNPGVYQVVTTHPITGCLDTNEIEVTQSVDTISAVLVNAVDLGCNGDSGSIEIINVIGSSGPYTYALDNGSFGSSALFSGLSGGNYLVSVMDRYGCIYTSSVVVRENHPFTASVQPEFTIQKGGQQTISIQTNIPDSLLTSVEWLPGTGLSCSDCLTTIASPDETTTYDILITDSKGCTYILQVTVIVESSEDIYIPNVFSPNGDQFNDVLMIFGNENAIIQSFKIFDRWGELVFSVENGPTDDVAFAWDGTFNGERILPGVYAYHALVEINGTMISKFGSVTVIE